MLGTLVALLSTAWVPRALGNSIAIPNTREAKVAVNRAIPLIQLAGQKWLDRSTCTSCHHQAMSFVALQVAKDNGYGIDNRALLRQVAESNKRRFKYTKKMYELTGAINPVSGHGYQLLGMAAMRSPANDFTDAAGFFLTGKQSSIGHWPSSSHRPPIEDSPFTLAATSIRALSTYSFGTQGDAAIERARAWMLRTKPKSAEERAMKLLGLYWSKAAPDQIRQARRAILAEQHSDGGWSQVSGRPSDVYATGQALVALRTAGDFSAKSMAYQQGAKYLISTQKSDGSWRVPTRRVVEGLPYFETGFPYGVDQFISMAGTCWATAALAAYSENGNMTAMSKTVRHKGRSTTSHFAKNRKDKALFDAVLYGTNLDVQRALENGGNPNAESTAGTTPLILAVRSSDKVRTLLKAGADPNLASGIGSTPLTVASASYNALPSMRLLLDAKADPNKGRIEEREVPIYAATAAFENERLKLLIDRGAKILNQTLWLSYSYQNVGAVDFLLSQKVDVNQVNEEYGGNPVNDVVIDRNPILLELILEYGGNPNVVDKEEFSPLQVAAMGDPEDSKLVSLLLRAGANIRYQAKGKPTPLELAEMRGNRASAELIRAEMQRQSRAGQTKGDGK